MCDFMEYLEKSYPVTHCTLVLFLMIFGICVFAGYMVLVYIYPLLVIPATVLLFLWRLGVLYQEFKREQ